MAANAQQLATQQMQDHYSPPSSQSQQSPTQLSPQQLQQYQQLQQLQIQQQLLALQMQQLMIGGPALPGVMSPPISMASNGLRSPLSGSLTYLNNPLGKNINE